MYYKLGQGCVTNWGSLVLLQVTANVVTNWGKCCYKLGQLLQFRATVITKQGSYYKLGQVLQIRAIIKKYVCITNWGKLVLQIGAASLLEIGASVVTNWGSYYKLGQSLLQNRAAIANWGKIYTSSAINDDIKKLKE